MLQDTDVYHAPSEKPVLPEEAIGDLRGVYPDAHMIDPLGDAPAYALWARHVAGLRLEDYRVVPTAPDPRPAFVLRTGVRLEGGAPPAGQQR